uniref:hypothetical protein n=1 Tax=uncultured Sphingomonas sp. TaxID=158754 RepID=UPI0035CB4B34
MSVSAAALTPFAANSAAVAALPFDLKAITGLSAKLLVGHHDNNYVGALKHPGAITGRFAALDPATAAVRS